MSDDETYKPPPLKVIMPPPFAPIPDDEPVGQPEVAPEPKRRSPPPPAPPSLHVHPICKCGGSCAGAIAGVWCCRCGKRAF